jgi:hypothetical protein
MAVSFGAAAAMPLLTGGAAGGALSALGGPVGLALGGLQMGLGLLQSNADQNARQQQYLNETAYQNASTQFNQWQAGINRDLSNLNNQYAYWRETVQYNQSLAYTNQLRNYEFSKELAQAKRVAEARTGAGLGYSVQSQAIQQALQERGMQEAVAMQQYTYRALQQSATYQASAQEGKSMDRYVRHFDRQVGDFQTLQQIGQKFQQRQFKREQLAALTTYLNQYNSQQFYEPTPYMDPVAPFPPLPTMVMPPPPSMTGSAPSNPSALNAGTAFLGGLQTSLGYGAKVNKLANG